MKKAAAIAWPLVGCTVLAFETLLSAALGAPYTSQAVFWAAVGWCEWMLLAPIVVALAERFPYRPDARARFFLVHLIAPFVVSTMHSSIFFALRLAVNPYEHVTTTWIVRVPVHLTLDLLVYGGTLLATHVALFLRNTWSREQQRLELEKEIAQAELDLLRLQLPPTEIAAQLEAIEAAIEHDAMDAERKLMRLSAFLRERLELSRKQPVELTRSEVDPDPPRRLPLPILLLLILGLATLSSVMITGFGAIRDLVMNVPVAWNDIGAAIALTWFSWPVTLLMIWLGSRVKQIAILVVAAAAAPLLWIIAFHSMRSGWPAARDYLLSSSRSIDFLLFFAIALGALAHQRYVGWRMRAVGVAELDAVLLRTRTRLLRLQLNPHFLFNTLNSIAALLDDERDAARRMSARLRDFVQRVLTTTDTHEVPLGEELQLLSTYFAIENVRFGDRLQLDLDVSKRANGALVPSFLLQPLVENALRHGLQPETGGLVSVSAAVDDQALRLEVLDSGRPRANVVREGIGLSNTRARLRQLYGDAFAFDVERRDSGFRARLTIPFRPVITT